MAAPQPPVLGALWAITGGSPEVTAYFLEDGYLGSPWVLVRPCGNAPLCQAFCWSLTVRTALQSRHVFSGNQLYPRASLASWPFVGLSR